MSAIVDRTQVDGYAPDVRMIEDVTSGDLQSVITIGNVTIAPWMSPAGCRFWVAKSGLRDVGLDIPLVLGDDIPLMGRASTRRELILRGMHVFGHYKSKI